MGSKSLKTLKPVCYEREPKTLGQHLKKRRVELGLLQRDLRKRFQLEKETYANWEKDRCYPAMKHWPNIIAFLGYDPYPEPTTLGERLTAYRRKHGVSRKALAITLGADEGTLLRWEGGERMPTTKAHFSALQLLLD
jgi:DNA-binding XRE family transcriptional regulator